MAAQNQKQKALGKRAPRWYREEVPSMDGTEPRELQVINKASWYHKMLIEGFFTLHGRFSRKWHIYHYDNFNFDDDTRILYSNKHYFSYYYFFFFP